MLMSFATAAAVCAIAFAQSGNVKDVIGTWEGESICTVHPSACHDEHVIYEISDAGKAKLKMSADKVVNGERQNMGDLACTYDGKTLSCPFAKGLWAFEVKGAKMAGTLKLTDGTLFRKVSVNKKHQDPGK
jgi:hypothetical protein